MEDINVLNLSAIDIRKLSQLSSEIIRTVGFYVEGLQRYKNLKTNLTCVSMATYSETVFIPNAIET